MRPYSIVEDVGLKLFITNLSNNHYELPSRKLITQLVPDLFMNVEKIVCYIGVMFRRITYQVHEMFLTEGEDIWLTADGWTSQVLHFVNFVT